MLPLNPSEFLEDEPVVPLCEKPNDHINLMYQGYYQAAIKKTECELRSSIYMLDTALEFLGRGHASSAALYPLALSLAALGVSVVMGYIAAANLMQLHDTGLGISSIEVFTFIGVVGILGTLAFLIFGGRRVQKQIPQYLLYKHACEQCLETKTYIGGKNTSSAAVMTIQPAAQIGSAESDVPVAAPLIDEEPPAVLSGQDQI